MKRRSTLVTPEAFGGEQNTLPRKHKRGHEKLLLSISAGWAGEGCKLQGLDVQWEGGLGSSERARQVAGCPVSPWCLLVSSPGSQLPASQGWRRSYENDDM